MTSASSSPDALTSAHDEVLCRLLVLAPQAPLYLHPTTASVAPPPPPSSSSSSSSSVSSSGPSSSAPPSLSSSLKRRRDRLQSELQAIRGSKRKVAERLADVHSSYEAGLARMQRVTDLSKMEEVVIPEQQKKQQQGR